jgi:hypothetical protein
MEACGGQAAGGSSAGAALCRSCPNADHERVGVLVGEGALHVGHQEFGDGLLEIVGRNSGRRDGPSGGPPPGAAATLRSAHTKGLRSTHLSGSSVAAEDRGGGTGAARSSSGGDTGAGRSSSVGGMTTNATSYAMG